jgi:hypothetical protein
MRVLLPAAERVPPRSSAQSPRAQTAFCRIVGVGHGWITDEGEQLVDMVPDGCSDGCLGPVSRHGIGTQLQQCPLAAGGSPVPGSHRLGCHPLLSRRSRSGRPVVDLPDTDHPSGQCGILGILPFELVAVSPQMCPAALLESGQVVIVTDQGLYIGLGCAVGRRSRLVALGRLLASAGQATRSPNIGDRERIVGNRC